MQSSKRLLAKENCTPWPIQQGRVSLVVILDRLHAPGFDGETRAFLPCSHSLITYPPSHHTGHRARHPPRPSRSTGGGLPINPHTIGAAGVIAASNKSTNNAPNA